MKRQASSTKIALPCEEVELTSFEPVNRIHPREMGREREIQNFFVLRLAGKDENEKKKFPIVIENDRRTYHIDNDEGTSAAN